MSAKHKLRAKKHKQKTRKRWWRKLHRLVGIFSAFFLLLLATTGVMLNHVDDWFDNSKFVSNPLLLDWYSITPPQEVRSFHLPNSGSAASFWADGALFINAQLVAADIEPPIAHFLYDEIFYLVAQNSMHLYSLNGEFVEELSFPTPVNKVYRQQSSLLVTGDQQYLVNLDSLEILDGRGISLSPMTDLNRSVRTLENNTKEAQIARQHRLLRSKVLQDLHSGRLFGTWGTYFFDALAVCFVVLALSGIFLWSRGLSRPRQRVNNGR